MVINEGYDAAGNRIRWSRSTGLKEKGNRRKANAMLTELLDELNKKRTARIKEGNTPFFEIVQDWLAYSETQV